METRDIIIHGGYYRSSLKDTWKATIDSDKNQIKWEQLKDSPEARKMHSSEIIGSLCIFIGGDKCHTTMAYNHSTQEYITADPIKLKGHKSWIYNQTIQVFGGENNDSGKKTKEMLRLNLKEMFGDGDFENLLKVR